MHACIVGHSLADLMDGHVILILAFPSEFWCYYLTTSEICKKKKKKLWIAEEKRPKINIIKPKCDTHSHSNQAHMQMHRNTEREKTRSNINFNEFVI